GVDLDCPAADAHDPLFPPRVAVIAGDPILPREQVKIVRLDVCGPALLDRFLFFWEQLQLQGADDGFRDFVLDGEDVLEVTVVTSSLIPSLKYSCSASPLMFWNGSTQTQTCWRRGRALLSATTLGASAWTLATSLRQPGESVSPDQPLRSAHWIWLKGSGGMTPSSDAWIRLPADRAASA